MKKYIYIFPALFASLLLANQQQATAQEVEVSVEESQSSGGLKRATPLASANTFDKRLENSQKIVDIRNDLRAAARVHNFGEQLLNNLVGVVGFEHIIEEHEFAKQQLAANISCNINLLNQYYHDASDVWAKMSTWAYDTLKAQEPAMEVLDQELFDAYSAQGSSAIYNDTVMGKTMKSMRETWDIGNRILTDVYANQSKWGKKKTPFPLWGDQQYLYDSQWNRKYGEIKERLVEEYSHLETRYHGTDNEYSECILESWVYEIPDKGPEVADIYKYDHEDFDPKLGTQSVLKAHNEYVEKIEKRPEGLNLSVMHAPPQQLPPLPESIYYFLWSSNESFYKHFTPYPGLPNVWNEFFASGTVFFNQRQEDHFYNPSPNPNKETCPKFVHYNALGDQKYASEIEYYINKYPKSLASYVMGNENERIRNIDEYPSNLARVQFEGFRNDRYPFYENRVQSYLDNRLHEEKLEELATEAKEKIKETNQWLVDRLKKYDIAINDDFNVADINDYNNAMNLLKAKQDYHLGEARKKFDAIIPTEEHLLPHDLDEYKVFVTVFDVITLDKDLIASIRTDKPDEFPEDLIEAQQKVKDSWEAIRVLREAPTSPDVGCPIM